MWVRILPKPSKFCEAGTDSFMQGALCNITKSFSPHIALTFGSLSSTRVRGVSTPSQHLRLGSILSTAALALELPARSTISDRDALVMWCFPSSANAAAQYSRAAATTVLQGPFGDFPRLAPKPSKDANATAHKDDAPFRNSVDVMLNRVSCQALGQMQQRYCHPLPPVHVPSSFYPMVGGRLDDAVAHMRYAPYPTGCLNARARPLHVPAMPWRRRCSLRPLQGELHQAGRPRSASQGIWGPFKHQL